MIKFKFCVTLFLCLTACVAFSQSKTTSKHGTLLTEKLSSTTLKDNRVGLNVERPVKIFLPPGYQTSGKPYPVVYFLHNIFWDTEKMFADGRIVALMERAFSNNVAREFIFVAADYSTAVTGSLFENSTTSGRWLDFTVDELVPFIDSKFRTLRNRESRAITGEFMGGRGALKLAMTRSDLFSVMYALHPVATGTGYIPLPGIDVDWKRLHEAKSFDDLSNEGRTRLFVAICQAFLPNPGRPPFYCDFYMEPEAGQMKVNVANVRKGYFDGFLLEETLDESAANLKTMRGLAFDWGRFDPNQSHVYSNRAFSLKLEDLGIDHEAEEYRGDPFNRVWTDDGRFYTRMLPFLGRHLVFE